jgi:acetyl/propionyl-CoA carboxylase alpha subunit
MQALLIANRGEIAIRIARACADLGVKSVAIHSEDDAESLHVRRADDAVALSGKGPRAYLDAAQIIAKAREAGAEAIHPGYGFLSESAAFARAVADADLLFVGPPPEVLERFGDKVAARALAQSCDVPTPAGAGPVTAKDAHAFFAALPHGRAMLIKAVSGGGGRGMRIVRDAAEIDEALTRAASEAGTAFGDTAVYVEELLARVRHVEVQIAGDGSAVTHFYERECSLQRRHQKIVEIAPSPGLDPALRKRILDAALRMAKAVSYKSLGTMEFLVSAESGAFWFIEGNARLQVEHTVTEAILGVDLVTTQIDIARGRTLKQLGLAKAPEPRGHAIQLRVNLETMEADGSARPGGGRLAAFEPPSGPGVRVDAYGYAGYRTSPAFDSLIAKLICHAPSADYADAVARARRALAETKIEGAPTNVAFLRALLDDPRVAANEVDTHFIDANAPALVAAALAYTPGAAADTGARLAGARLASADPLAVLDHGKGAAVAVAQAQNIVALADEALPEGVVAVAAPMQGTIVSFAVAPGEAVWAGRVVAIMEAMKMEHEVRAAASGVVERLGAAPGDTVFERHPLVYLEAREVARDGAGDEGGVDLDFVRPDLQEVFRRKAAGLDENRPEAVAKRRKTGNRTARENIADLCDPGSFVEYGSVVLAAQRRRRTIEDLIANTTGDGMVCGLGRVNGDLFGPERARVMAMSYDYMVLAGTQGKLNHYKKDRMFELAEKHRLPTVLFAEGGGGRPGDTDATGVAGLDCLAFNYFAQLSGLVPLVGITTGRCFAGNAILLGCCDVIIATEGSNIGVGGPAMIEGGGLGVFKPEEVGPLDVQSANGVVDIAVKDEAEAVAAAKKYLSYFQGVAPHWEAPDARALRFVVPENRLRWYDMRKVIEGIADIGTALELRKGWGPGLITTLIRVEGRPIGVIANNPGHLSGAIDSPGADKGARFMQLCDAFDIPVLTLVDCPGIMVGPEIEKTALVRHACRMMVVGANVETPLMSVIVRKGYGLGAQAMCGGSFRAPLFVVTWPTGEFGGMGLEGAVKLGYRKELQALTDLEERKALYDKMVAQSYQRGKAVNMASHFELDDVIDPAETRRWIIAGLDALPPKPERTHKKRPQVDTW